MCLFSLASHFSLYRWRTKRRASWRWRRLCLLISKTNGDEIGYALVLFHSGQVKRSVRGLRVQLRWEPVQAVSHIQEGQLKTPIQAVSITCLLFYPSISRYPCSIALTGQEFHHCSTISSLTRPLGSTSLPFLTPISFVGTTKARGGARGYS